METDDMQLSGYKVIVLRAGFISHDGGIMKRQCTISLITGPKKILVETGSAWDRQWLIESLRTQGGCSPEDIDYVVCSHARCDLIGNLNLFPQATHIIGCEIQPASGRGTEYLCHDFAEPFEIDNFVRVTATPGHTACGVTVIVKGTPLGTVAITGPLFGSMDDFENPIQWLQWSQDEDQQLLSRDKILAKSDHIIPGRGEMFRVQPSFLRTPSIQEVDE